MTASYPGGHLSVRQRILYIVVLGGLTTLGPFTIDLYLPSFPALSKDLGVGTGAVQVTLTATTLGFAVGQLLIGSWTDRVGRRIPLIVASSVHVVASLTVAIARMLSRLALVTGISRWRVIAPSSAFALSPR